MSQRATVPAAADTVSDALGFPAEPLQLYTAVVLGGHPALRLKSLIIVDRDGRRVLSTKPVIDVLGEAAA
jgi:hypothetical protein